MKKSFMYDGASIWNSLPKNIRESNSLSSFKRKIAIPIAYKENHIIVNSKLFVYILIILYSAC